MEAKYHFQAKKKKNPVGLKLAMCQESVLYARIKASISPAGSGDLHGLCVYLRGRKFTQGCLRVFRFVMDGKADGRR